MKLLDVENIRAWDKYTSIHEPIASIDLMERAASTCYRWLDQHYDTSKRIAIFVGMGNNGGDGLVIARLLHGRGFQVKVWVVAHSKTKSKDFATNEERLGEVPTDYIVKIDDFPELSSNYLVVDAILGSGLTRKPTGLLRQVIEKVNDLNVDVVAIDIPSGLHTDRFTSQDETAIIKAQHTLTFQIPKFSFLFAESANYTGQWHVMDIGLHPGFLAEAPFIGNWVERQEVRSWLLSRQTFDHKGTFGHALVIAGSMGKMGAAVMATQACLRSGVGLVTSFVPKCGYDIMQVSNPEAMTLVDEDEKQIISFPDLSLYKAVAIGPGLGVHGQTEWMLLDILKEAKIPLVLDADAINLCARLQQRYPGPRFPKGTVLTPHIKEFERMVGVCSSGIERFEKQLKFAQTHQVTIVLKGPYTSIITPEGNCYFNSTGNAGMATGGSGDVLTGLIAGLIARGYQGYKAAVLGVYIHGLAADIAAQSKGQESLMARDIIESIPLAFNQLYATP